jgi:uncharacterized protein involved in type VI secretion and phage assembly
MLIHDLDYENRSSKIYGVVTAIVTNNKDPENMGRVKVNYPWLAENDESHWARIATMMAGNDRGTYFIPEVDDEVLVAFEHGDIHYPYIIGALWNGKDKVHENNSDGKNNLRVIKSRSGHKVIFDDTEGNEKITVIDKTEQRSIVIDSKQKTIDIRNEDGKINIFAGDDINIETNKNLNINTGQNTNVEASTNIDMKATSNANIKANSSANFEAGASVKVKGSMSTVEASGITTVKGSLVKLN